MLKDFLRVLQARRMVRKYQKRVVEPEKIETLLRLAHKAPSAGHTQPQEFVVVTNPQTKKQLCAAAYDQEWVEKAPALIVVLCDVTRSASRYGERGVYRYSVIDGTFSSMIILLGAVHLGLGACFVGAFKDEDVRKTLKAPAFMVPVGILCLGYPDEKTVKLDRRPFAEIIHKNWYGS